MTSATFYVMKLENEPKLPVSAHFHLACHLAADCYRQNKRVFMYVATQDEAHMLDEYLWQFAADQFVPHNLSGEGPRNGAPVEISWQNPTSRRQVMINLTNGLPNFASNYSEIIDFVPSEEKAKQAARERYKILRQAGVNLETIDIASADALKIEQS